MSSFIDYILSFFPSYFILSYPPTPSLYTHIGSGWGGVGVGVGAGVHRLLGREHEALCPTRRSVGASRGARGACCPTPAPPRRGTG